MNVTGIKNGTLYKVKLNSIRLRNYAGILCLANMVATVLFVALFGPWFFTVSALFVIVLLIIVLRFDVDMNVLLLKDNGVTYLRHNDVPPVIFGYDELIRVELVKGIKTSGCAMFIFKDGTKYKGVLERGDGLDVLLDDFRGFVFERNKTAKVFMR
ncbi:hypothetical protein AM493_19890 [Flavobacterium akiainvivens]|uniref:Uncharacterized protein n=2 Tax=Flavobacterium akiainvivens TaxID=1202724 RepID=A0A0M8MLL7_9FLAO|nr:hypothetical protein AM493_19890 [Flavobacterium akiainvivens]SFQ62428.1 hypothetical protein SAMN05444144_110123 [Flavobacterium akiainvivens]